jgi:hypothetical protein
MTQTNEHDMHRDLDDPAEPQAIAARGHRAAPNRRPRIGHDRPRHDVPEPGGARRRHPRRAVGADSYAGTVADDAATTHAGAAAVVPIDGPRTGYFDKYSDDSFNAMSRKACLISSGSFAS